MSVITEMAMGKRDVNQQSQGSNRDVSRCGFQEDVIRHMAVREMSVIIHMVVTDINRQLSERRQSSSNGYGRDVNHCLCGSQSAISQKALRKMSFIGYKLSHGSSF